MAIATMRGDTEVGLCFFLDIVVFYETARDISVPRHTTRKPSRKRTFLSVIGQGWSVSKAVQDAGVSRSMVYRMAREGCERRTGSGPLPGPLLPVVLEVPSTFWPAHLHGHSSSVSSSGWVQARKPPQLRVLRGRTRLCTSTLPRGTFSPALSSASSPRV